MQNPEFPQDPYQFTSEPSKPKPRNNKKKGHKFVDRIARLTQNANVMNAEIRGVFGTENPVPRREKTPPSTLPSSSKSSKVTRSRTLPTGTKKPKLTQRQQTASMSGINKAAARTPQNLSMDEEYHLLDSFSLKIPTQRGRSYSHSSMTKPYPTPGQTRTLPPMMMASNQSLNSAGFGFSPASPAPQQSLFPQQNRFNLKRQNSENLEFLHQHWSTTNSNAYFHQLNHSSGSLLSPACTTASNSPFGSNSQLMGFNYGEGFLDGQVIQGQGFLSMNQLGGGPVEKRQFFDHQFKDGLNQLGGGGPVEKRQFFDHQFKDGSVTQPPSPYSPSMQFSQMHLGGSMVKHESFDQFSPLPRHYSLDSNGSMGEVLRSPPPLIQINGVDEELSDDDMLELIREIIMDEEKFPGEIC